MRVLVDTDVLLDVALAREPHAAHSAAVLRWAEAGGEAAVAWHTLSNCAYLLKGGGRPFLTRLLRMVEVAPAGTADARRAIELPMADLEDAFQAATAFAWGADAIVTRNIRDFRRSPVRALTPTAFLRQTGAEQLAALGGTEPRLRPIPPRWPPQIPPPVAGSNSSTPDSGTGDFIRSNRVWQSESIAV